jgi:hypothetical protein
MKTILSVCLFLLMGASAIAAGIEGSWTTEMKGPDGGEGMKLTFVFKMEGDKLTGAVQTDNGDTPISNTKVDGKSFYFEVSFNDMTIKHQCTLKEDDTISMKLVDSPMGDSELILKRKE